MALSNGLYKLSSKEETPLAALKYSSTHGVAITYVLYMEGLVYQKRRRGGVLAVYKIMHGEEKVDKEHFFPLSHNMRTRSHPMN